MHSLKDTHTHLHTYIDILMSVVVVDVFLESVAATKSEIVDQKCEKGRQMQKQKLSQA